MRAGVNGGGRLKRLIIVYKAVHSQGRYEQPVVSDYTMDSEVILVRRPSPLVPSLSASRKENMNIAIFYPDSEIQVDDDVIRNCILNMPYVTANTKFRSVGFQTVHALLLAGV